MNTLFWIIVAGLIVLALAFVVVPLLKKSVRVDDDHRQRNIRIARERLAELKQQLNEGLLTQAEFDAYYRELQLTLDNDLQTSEQVPQAARQEFWVVPLLLVLLPTASLLLYFLLGDPNAERKAELQTTTQQTLANIEGMVGALQQRLNKNPDDLEGWLMLGRSYEYIQQYQKAADAFAELNRRKPDDVDVIMQYANNLAMAREGHLSGEPTQWIERALSLSPENPNALWLAGMAKLEQGDHVAARNYWQKLLTLLPPNSEAVPQVQQMLASLEQQQAQPVANPVSIAVQVAIDPAVKSKFAPTTVVFVYAQAVSGPKMPLAIVRKSLADLPLTVTLDDSVAMQGGSRLGDFSQLRVVARVSQSGKAMPEAGDWTGSVEIQQPFNAQPVAVTINQEIQ